jgi:hypothetical protein
MLTLTLTLTVTLTQYLGISPGLLSEAYALSLCHLYPSLEISLVKSERESECERERDRDKTNLIKTVPAAKVANISFPQVKKVGLGLGLGLGRGSGRPNR